MNPSYSSQRPAFHCFHGFLIFAVAVFLGAVRAVAQDQPETQTNTAKKIGSYVFKPIEIKPSPHGFDYEGRFLFINKESSPVMMFGDDEPLDGKFEPMYPEFQTLKDGVWKKLAVGYCGLSPQFAMQPGEEYQFFMDLSRFDEQDAPLTGKIGLDGYWSEPFVLDWKRDRIAGKFDLARRENFEKARTLFAKAGFKKELLVGDDFCQRLFQSMMKEASAKDLAASFHPFVSKLKVTPGIGLNGAIRIDFSSDEVRNYNTEYTAWFSLNPSKFSPEWFRNATKQHVEVSEWGEGVKMGMEAGSNFDSPLYLSINYEPFDKTKRPSKEDSEILFRRMLGVLDTWLE